MPELEDDTIFEISWGGVAVVLSCALVGMIAFVLGKKAGEFSGAL